MGEIEEKEQQKHKKAAAEHASTEGDVSRSVIDNKQSPFFWCGKRRKMKTGTQTIGGTLAGDW